MIVRSLAENDQDFTAIDLPQRDTLEVGYRTLCIPACSSSAKEVSWHSTASIMAEKHGHKVSHLSSRMYPEKYLCIVNLHILHFTYYVYFYLLSPLYLCKKSP